MKRSWKLVALTLFILFLVCGSDLLVLGGQNKKNDPELIESTFTQNTLQDSSCDWPSFGRTPDNNRVAPDGCGPKTNNLVKLWEFKFPQQKAMMMVKSDPVLLNGKIYIGSRFLNKILCLKALTGEKVWEYDTEDGEVTAPIVSNGRIYFGSSIEIDEDQYMGRIYCLDALSGEKIWARYIGAYILASPVVANGRLFVGSNDKKLYCVDALKGEKIWEYRTGLAIISTPALSNGKVFIASKDYRLHCVDELSGRKLWEYRTNITIESSPSVADGRVYVGSRDKNLYCLNVLSGKVIWVFRTGGEIYSTPVILERTVYMGSEDKKFYCLDALSGKKIWEFEADDSIHSSSAISGENVYFSSGRRLYILNVKNGSKLGVCDVGYSDSSPIISGGKIYIGSSDGVCCFGDAQPPSAGTCCDNCTDCNKCMAFKVGSKDWFICNQLQTPMSTAPIIKNGRTFLVIRYIAETIGANVDWNATSQTVTITDPKNGKTIQLQINNNIATIGGKKVQIDQNTDVKPF
ncbi:MAG: PQQ-binding-like beta-propeller repeat protein, partial [Caldisericales bacterium]|nr:PQQ-binding-like beta-propeller repeat protein [Caldisericales bacterium]